MVRAGIITKHKISPNEKSRFSNADRLFRCYSKPLGFRHNGKLHGKVVVNHFVAQILEEFT